MLSWILPAVLFILVAYMAWNIIPRSVFLIRPSTRKFYFDDNPEVPMRESSLQLLKPTLEKLEARGFTRLGLMVEKQPLWAKGSRELAYASAEAKTLVSLGVRGYRPAYFFYTPFIGGQVVITAYNAFRNSSAEGFKVTVVANGDIEEMLVEHQRQVEAFKEKGYAPFAEYDRDSVIRATQQYYNSQHTLHQLRLAGTISLLYLLIFIAIFVLLIRIAVF